MLQVLLEVGHLARQLALRGAVLCILLLHLGQVLELDSLPLEDAPLHVFDELLLLLAEQLVLKLHAMDLLLHRNDFSLTDGRVKSILHLFFKLVLALPKEDLLLSFDNFDQDVTLLLLELGDAVLKLDGLILELLELLLELHLDVEVVVGELLLLLVVLVDQVVELVHLEGLVLLRHFHFSDALVMCLDLTIDADLFLIKNRLLSAQVVVLCVHLGLISLLFDELDLVGNPVLLDVRGLVVDLLDLFLDVIAVVFDGANELVTISLALQLGADSVQSVHFQCLFLNLEQASLDSFLLLLDVLLLVSKLIDEIIKFLAESLVLCRGVEVVKTHTGNLVGVVFVLNLLLGDLLIGILGLLLQVSGGLLDRLLLGGVRDNVVTDGLHLCVQLHDALVQHIVLRLNIRSFLVHSRRLSLSLSQRVLEHDLLLVQLLFLSLELAHARGKELDLLLALV